MYYLSSLLEMLHFPVKTLIPPTAARNFYLICLLSYKGEKQTNKQETELLSISNKKKGGKSPRGGRGGYNRFEQIK